MRYLVCLSVLSKALHVVKCQGTFNSDAAQAPQARTGLPGGYNYANNPPSELVRRAAAQQASQDQQSTPDGADGPTQGATPSVRDYAGGMRHSLLQLTRCGPW
jgi:hypothetical protein